MALYTRKMLQQPTAGEVNEISMYMNSLSSNVLYQYLISHPHISLDSIRDKDGMTPYMYVLHNPSVDISSPLFYEVVRRNPDPFLTDNKGQTASQMMDRRIQDFAYIGTLIGKMSAKRQFSKDYEYEFLARKMQNLSSARNAFPEGMPIPLEAESLVSEYLSGESGPLPVAQSKLRVKSGQPGVPTRGGKKRKQTKKRKRNTK